jgi:pimeloyl-ACP methyl ester carboxylesterase
MGDGPGVIVLHGGGANSLSVIKLASALSDRFSVYVPDRRGRGLSPSTQDDGLRSDIEDLEALLDKTGSERVFGVSSGAVVALEAALRLRAINRLALFEPPLSFEGVSTTDWVPRYERELAEGRKGAALVTVLKGTEGNAVPRFILVPVFSFLVKRAPQIGEIVEAMQRDVRLVREATGPLSRFAGLHCKALLIGAGKSPANLKAALDGLAGVLPEAARVTIPGVGHRAALDEGKPELVAEHLARFFA